MKLKDQVVSLELAKKLKELGVKQESLFAWYYIDAPTAYTGPELGYRGIDFPSEASDIIAALTVAELGDLLKHSDYYLPYSSEDWTVWECRVGNTEDGDKQYLQAPTEADCRAKMLIYLLEHQLITK